MPCHCQCFSLFYFFFYQISWAIALVEIHHEFKHFKIQCREKLEKHHCHVLIKYRCTTVVFFGGATFTYYMTVCLRLSPIKKKPYRFRSQTKDLILNHCVPLSCVGTERNSTHVKLCSVGAFCAYYTWTHMSLTHTYTHSHLEGK